MYLRARYYSLALGVFTGLDPFEGGMNQPMSLNRYGYVQGNVVNAVDPSGMVFSSPRPEKWDSCSGRFGPGGGAWSCIDAYPSMLDPVKDLWACGGAGCQQWLKQALCVLLHGTPSNPSTSFTQQYGTSVLLYNGAFKAPRINFHFGSVFLWPSQTVGGENIDRFNILLPPTYLQDNDFASQEFLEHLSITAHEVWHSMQSFALPSILKEVEAFNMQTLILRDLGALSASLPSTVALTPLERLDMLNLGLPTPFGTGVTRDYCKLCTARRYMLKDAGPGYDSMPIISEPIPVLTEICEQYHCVTPF